MPRLELAKRQEGRKRGGDDICQNTIHQAKQYAPSISTKADKSFTAKELKKAPYYTLPLLILLIASYIRSNIAEVIIIFNVQSVFFL